MKILERYIADQVGAASANITDQYRLTNGAIQENWAITVRISDGHLEGERKFCLRMDAPSKIGNSRNRVEEFAFLNLAHNGGVRVPEPLICCDDENLIGRQFFVMQWIDGVADARKITQNKFCSSSRKRLLTDIGAELALIHNLNPKKSDFPFLKTPRIAPAQHIIHHCRQALDALPQASPILEWGLRWAELNLPKTQPKVLCHRDYRIGNLMIDRDSLVGVLDWEFSDWSDPMEDIAWFCAKCWRFGFNEREAGGIGPRATFYEAYESASKRSIDHNSVIFWEVIAHIRWAIIAHQQGERFATYGERSLEPAMTAFIAPQLEWEVIKMVENLEK